MPSAPIGWDRVISPRSTALPISALKRLFRTEASGVFAAVSPHSATIAPWWITITAIDPMCCDHSSACFILSVDHPALRARHAPRRRLGSYLQRRQGWSSPTKARRRLRSSAASFAPSPASAADHEIVSFEQTDDERRFNVMRVPNLEDFRRQHLTGSNGLSPPRPALRRSSVTMTCCASD